MKSNNTSTLLTPEARDELIGKVGRARTWVLSATRILVRTQGRRIPEARGSTVLFRVRERLFLLSARHVFDSFLDGTMNIASPPNFAPITGGISRALEDDTGKDPYDAAVLAVAAQHTNDELLSAALTVDALEPKQGRVRRATMRAP